MATETSEAERRATGAERELMDWKTAQFMEAHLGEEYDALIISIQKFGCFVELFEVFVEGLLSVNALEEFAAPAASMRTRSRHGRPIKSGRPPWQAWRPPWPRLQGKTDGMASRRPRSCPRRRIDPMRKRVEFALVSGN